MSGTRVPGPGCIAHAQLVRQLDKDYGWVNSDKLTRQAQYMAVRYDLDYIRVLNFAELWFLLHNHTVPDTKDVLEIMMERSTLFMYVGQVGFGREEYEKIKQLNGQ